MKIRQIIFIFLPALFLVSFIFFIRIIQYEPLNPQPEKTLAEQQKERSVIPVFPEDPIVGEKPAAQTIILFGDFACEQCKNEYKMLTALMSEHPKKLKIIWKGLPVTKFPFDSENAHKYAFCSHQQGQFTNWAQGAFENNAALSEETLISISTEKNLDAKKLQTCLNASETASYLQKTKELAQVLNIQAVPAIFLNSNQIPSPKSLEEWKSLLSL